MCKPKWKLPLSNWNLKLLKPKSNRFLPLWVVPRSFRFTPLVLSRISGKVKIYNGVKFIEFRPFPAQSNFLAGSFSWSKRTGQIHQRAMNKKRKLSAKK